MRGPLVANDWPAIYGRPMGHRDQSAADRGGPSFWTLIADKYASFLGHFRSGDIGLTKTPIIGHPYPRLGPRERAPQIPNA